MDAFFDDEPGYRVRADQFALPEISSSPTRPRSSAWRPGSGSTRGWPRRPRRRSGSSPRPASSSTSRALDIAEPRLSADEPSFDVFWEATQERQPGRVRVPPLRRDRAAITRHLQPWGVVRYSGRWYAVGLDTDRGEERVFRLSRVAGRGAPGRHPGLVRVPAGHRRPRRRPAAGARRRRPRRPSSWYGRARGTRCAATPAASSRTSTAPTSAPPGTGSRTRGGAQADELLAFGADVYVEAPAGAAGRGRRPAPRRRGRRSDEPPRRHRAAKDQVARLLRLVPYLHARDQVRWTRRRRRSAYRPPSCSRTSGPVPVRPARRLPRRPHRRRPRRPGGRGGRHPGLQRRLPGPAAAADAHRGERDHRGAAGAARRARDETREVVDRALAKLEAAAAGAGPRLPGRPRGRRPGAPARCGAPLERRGARPAPGAAHLLRARARRGVRAGRRPARRRSPPTASPTSTPSATARTRRGSSGSTASTRRGARQRRSRRRPMSPATSPTASSAARRRRWSRSACARRRGGWRSTTRGGGPAPAGRRRRGRSAGRGRAVAPAAAAAPRAVRRGRLARSDYAETARRAAIGRALGLYDHPGATMTSNGSLTSGHS